MAKVNSFILLEPNSVQGNTEQLTKLLSDYNVKTISVSKSSDADTLRFKIAISQLDDKDTGLILVKDNYTSLTDAATLKTVVNYAMSQSDPVIINLGKSSSSQSDSLSFVKDSISGIDAVLLNPSAIASIKKNYDTSITLSNKSISDDDVPLKSPKFYDDGFADEETIPSSINDALLSMANNKTINVVSTSTPLFNSKDTGIAYYNPTDSVPTDVSVVSATNIPQIQNTMNTIYAPSSTESMMYSGWFLFVLVILLIILLIIIIYSYFTQEDYYYYTK